MPFSRATERVTKVLTSTGFSQKTPKSHKPSYTWVTFTVLSAGLLCLVGIWFTLEEHREHFLHARFYLAAQHITGKIGDKVTAYTEILRGAAGLFAGSNKVTRDDWHAYVEKLDLDQSYKGIQGVGFALYIPADKLNAHIAALRHEGFADYVVKPEGQRESYTSIIYLEPFSGRNLRAFGYDMYSEPVRREALDIARDTGAIAISGKVKLVQETKVDVQAGILAYHPVYANGSVLQTLAQRRAALVGWVYSPYRMNDLMESALQGELNNLQLEIFDGETTDAKALLYDSVANSMKMTGDTVLRPMSLTSRLELEGRVWTLRYTELPGFAAQATYASLWRETAGLFVIGLLLTGLFWSQANTRKQAELIAQQLTASLRESEEHYRALFDFAQVSILFIDPEKGVIVEANRAACLYYGYSDAQLRGMSIEVINILPIGDVKEKFRGAAMENQSHVYCRNRLANGEVRDVEVHLGPIQLGGRLLLYSIVHDITERKRAEDALQQLNETLEYRVQAELIENRNKDHLIIQQSRFAAMGEMIGNIAHQWRQPLNTLMLTLANIEDAHHYNELTGEYLATQVADGKRLIHKMSSTIDDFRNFFRPHKEAEPFSAAKAIHEAVSLVSASFHNNHIDIELELGKDVFIQGFANEFSQVLLNLFANAKDAILKNHVVAGKLRVKLSLDGQSVVVIVADNGGGIPEAIMEKIFEPYFSTKEMGTGVGLYMSKMIIEKSMHGTLNAHNQGSGAEFVVCCQWAGQPDGVDGAVT